MSLSSAASETFAVAAEGGKKVGAGGRLRKGGDGWNCQERDGEPEEEGGIHFNISGGENAPIGSKVLPKKSMLVWQNQQAIGVGRLGNSHPLPLPPSNSD